MKKSLMCVLAVVVVLCCAIGGTVAWLMDRTDPVTNTFTVGDINIELTETTGDTYKMVPGNALAKDPKVTVLAGSEACWLFVKVEASANFSSFMTYEMADGWTALAGHPGVYYREVPAASVNTSFNIIKNNTVLVKDTVTKEMLNADDFEEPTLTFTAYAVQKDNVTTAVSAWEKL